MKKKILTTVLAIALLCTSFSGFSLFAERVAPVTEISDTSLTEVDLVKAYESYSGSEVYFADANGQKLENDTGAAYFDGIRTDASITMKINVKTAGEYYVYLTFAWYQSAGHPIEFTVDGGSPVTLTNTKVSKDWRDWTATDMVKMNLTAGEHSFKLTYKGVKDTGMNLKGIGFCLSSLLSDTYNYFDEASGADSMTPHDLSADQALKEVGVHFASKEPVVELQFDCPTWDQNPGAGLTFTFYNWVDTYAKTVTGTVVTTVTKEGINNNERVKVTFDTPLPAGNYLIVIKNSGTAADKKVGIWSRKSTTYTDYASMYLDGIKSEGATIQMVAKYKDKVLAPYADLAETVNSLSFFDPSKAQEAIDLAAVAKEYGIQFVATGPVAGFTFTKVPSWGNNVGDLRFTVYKWDGNYSKTLRGTKLAVKEAKSIPDNGVVTITLDSALPAAEYLLVVESITDPLDSVGLYVANEAFPYAVSYLGGEIVPNAALLVVNFAEPVIPNEYKAVSIPNPNAGDSSMLVSFGALVLVAAVGLVVLNRKKESHI